MLAPSVEEKKKELL